MTGSVDNDYKWMDRQCQQRLQADVLETDSSGSRIETEKNRTIAWTDVPQPFAVLWFSSSCD